MGSGDENNYKYVLRENYDFSEVNIMTKTYSRKLDGNKNLSVNFKVKEFACKDGSDYILIDTELVKMLQKIRDHFKKPITINSAYRNSKYNKIIGGVSNSQHTKGTAADIVVLGYQPKVIAEYIESIMPDKGGIGLYSSFVHIDTRQKRSRWQNFGKEISVKGFYNLPQPYKHYRQGITEIVEIDPRNIWNVETQCKTKDINYNNFVNGVFFMPQKNGIMFPQGMVVNAGQVMSNYQTHQKPVATLIVHSADNVEMKYVSDITKEENVWFAVSGFGVYPEITAEKEGFVGKFTDVLKSTNRPIIGYRKADNKIVIAVRRGSSAERAKQTAKNLGLDFAISLDGDGSATFKVGGKWKFKGDNRKIYGGIIFA